MVADHDVTAVGTGGGNGTSKERVVAAAIELLAEGNMSPTAHDIAKRANLGRRTVFRQFRDMEQLYESIIDVIQSRLTVIARPLQSVDWKAKVKEIAERRISYYQEFLPIQRAANAHIHRSPSLQASMMRRKNIMRAFLESSLPREVLNNTVLVEAIDLCLSYETWERLRFQQNLSQLDTMKVIEFLISKTFDT